MPPGLKQHFFPRAPPNENPDSRLILYLEWTMHFQPGFLQTLAGEFTESNFMYYRSGMHMDACGPHCKIGPLVWQPSPNGHGTAKCFSTASGGMAINSFNFIPDQCPALWRPTFSRCTLRQISQLVTSQHFKGYCKLI